MMPDQHPDRIDRLIEAALREPPAFELRDDFAERVAQRVMPQQRTELWPYAVAAGTVLLLLLSAAVLYPFLPPRAGQGALAEAFISVARTLPPKSLLWAGVALLGTVMLDRLLAGRFRTRDA